MTEAAHLRVLLVTPRYAPWIGGVESHVQHLAAGLRGLGVGLEVATTGGGPAVEVIDGVTVRRFAAFAPGGNYHISPELFRFVRRSADRFDIIHAHSYHSLTSLVAALGASRTQMVVTTHYHGVGHSAVRQALHVPYRPAARWMLNKAARLVCVSKSEERLLLEANPSLAGRTVVIPNGIDTAFFGAHSGEREEGLVLAVARLESYKRIDRLIEAVTHLPSEYHLLVAGTGPQQAELEMMAQQRGLAGRVRFAGALPDAALREAYRRAAVYVSLSSREAFGMTLLEAAASGCPVVASDLPSHSELREYADGIALVPEAATAVEIAQSIEAQIGVEAHLKDPSGLDWESIAANTLEEYRGVLSAGGRS